jgi:hypothetical protein
VGLQLAKRYWEGQIVVDDFSGASGTSRGEQTCREVLVEQLERKRPLGRHTCSWEENIKMNSKEIGWNSRD